jgi:hypothetical protein
MTRRQHLGQVLESTCHALSGSGVSRRAAAATVATILALAAGAHAVSSQENCLDLISGHLSATPSFIDRETSPSVESILTWSASVPQNCPFTPRLTLAGQTLQGLSGQLRVEVTRTRTFQLQHLLLPVLATATVTVQGDPGLITVSDGREITADDRAKFNGQWMQPFQQTKAEVQAESWLIKRFDAGAWETSERMAALARMYDLTRDRPIDERLPYVHQLSKLVKFAFDNRDDQHDGFDDPDTKGVFDFPPSPLDEIRGLPGLPAWGGKSPNSGGLHRVDEVVSSLYAYSLAAFARIVAEDPALHTAYGDVAIDYANAALQTVWLFMPQIRYSSAGDFVEAWLTLPLEYQLRPTESNCVDAYNEAVAGEPSKESRWREMLGNCRNLHIGAGTPVAHNINLAFAMVLIELSRVLDSPFYRQSTHVSPDAAPSRALFPLLVSRQQRYFVNRLRPWPSWDCRYCWWWNFSDDLPPPIKYHAEDTSHGALDMRYLDLLRRDFDRLNPLPASVGEPIPLDDTLLWRFANTFLHKIAVGTHFKDNVVSDTADPVDSRNGNCDGWMSLAVADVNVYHRCHEMSLRIVNGEQPYLNIGNHSALLMNKRFLPAPPPPPPPPPPPRMCPTGRKCCEPAPDGGCALCVPNRAQCP